MKIMRLVGFGIACLMLVACGKVGGSGSTGPSTSRVGPGFQEVDGGIFLSKDGKSFGPLYIEGSCDGSDNAGKNVTSWGSRNGKLMPRAGGCNVDIDFSFDILGRGSN